MELTVKEKNIIRHSLGLDYKKKPFRNNFVAGVGHSDNPELDSLVGKGAMVKRPYPFNEVTESYVYHVTEIGAAAVQVELPKN